MKKQISKIKDIVLTSDARNACVRITLKNKRSKGFCFETIGTFTAREKADIFLKTLKNEDTAKAVAEDIQFN
jgi:hypothetical protein